MRINSNISSLSAQRQLSTIAKAFARSLEKLASGKRINSARDDAAGLAISSGLEAQQRGLRQAVRNINDAKGYGETLTGVIRTQTDIVQRMKELAIQSANGILNSEQRGYLNSEFQELYNEFNRLSDQSEFNGEKIANGSFIKKAIQVGTKKGESINLELPSLLAKDIFVESRGSGAFTSYYFGGYNGGTYQWTNPGDVNNDGLIDIVGTSGSSAYISLSQGDGSFSKAATAYTVSGANGTWINVDDINEDGNADLMETTSSGYIIVALGNGNGTFQSPRTIASSPGTPRDIKAGDLDNDGDLDLVVGNFTGSGSTISIYYGNGDGTFEAAVTHVGSSSPYGIELVDLDSNGKLDIVTGGISQTTVFMNQGNRSYSTNSITVPTQFMEIADINADEKLDIVFTNSVNAYYGVMLGNGNGTFQTATTVAIAGANTRDLALKDLNGDTYLDFVIGDDTTAVVYYAFGKGNGTFDTVKTLAAELSYDIVLDDTNGDGALDIVVPGQAKWRSYLGIPQDTSALEKMTISTEEEASDVLAILDNALQRLANANATVGALINRLDSSQNASSILLESLAQARSQVEDTDYSAEMAEFVRLQILQSATVAVLSQANNSYKIALQLLKNF